MNGFKSFSRRAGGSVFGVYLIMVLLAAPGLASEETVTEEGVRPHPEPVPFKVLSVVRRQVDVLFKGVVENPFRQPSGEPKFIWGEGGKTEYVQVGQSLHGYAVGPLERRTVEVQDSGQHPRTVERFFITLSKKGENPVVIEIWKTARVTERIATLQATEGKWTVYYRGEKLGEDKEVFEVFEDCDIITKGEGGWRRFKVVGVGDETVTLKGTYEYTLKLPSRAASPAVQK